MHKRRLRNLRQTWQAKRSDGLYIYICVHGVYDDRFAAVACVREHSSKRWCCVLLPIQLTIRRRHQRYATAAGDFTTLTSVHAREGDVV